MTPTTVFVLDRPEGDLAGRLATADFDVTAVASPAELRRHLAMAAPDVVICPLRHPGGPGCALMRDVREQRPAALRLLAVDPDNDSDLSAAFADGVVHGLVPDSAAPAFLAATIAAQLNRCARNLEAERHRLERHKREFMMLTNHELRTPVTIIASALDMLAMRCGERDDIARFITYARRGSQRLTALLDLLSDTVSLEQGERCLQREAVDLRGLASTVLEESAAERAERRVAIDVEAGGDAAALGDPRLLKEVMLQLLSNAVKYTPDGGRVTMRMERRGAGVCLQVRDTGIGIPTGERERVFESFHQLGDIERHHSSRFAWKGSGTGRGLTFCYRTVTAHGGRIEIADSDGPGTVVTVTLPAASRERRQRPLRPRVAAFRSAV